jgi:predicted DNA-binding protein YlxM (UPF0122 family)
MAKDLKLVILLDFYGGLLTEKQAEALDGYYNQDFSLAEIAQDMNISRQGVMAFLKQGEKHLRAFEEKLGLAERFSQISETMNEMKCVAEQIKQDDKRDEMINLIDSVLKII